MFPWLWKIWGITGRWVWKTKKIEIFIVNIHFLVAVRLKILHQLLNLSAISMKWFKKSLITNSWKGYRNVKRCVRALQLQFGWNVLQCHSFNFTHAISKHLWRVPSLHKFFLWLCFTTISERGLDLITTLTSLLHVLISPWDEEGVSEADTCSTLMLCQRFALDSVWYMGVFWKKKAY